MSPDVVYKDTGTCMVCSWLQYIMILTSRAIKKQCLLTPKQPLGLNPKAATLLASSAYRLHSHPRLHKLFPNHNIFAPNSNTDSTPNRNSNPNQLTQTLTAQRGFLSPSKHHLTSSCPRFWPNSNSMDQRRKFS